MADLIKHILFEYYERISTLRDCDILGNWLVYVYINDRPRYTPHCHVINKQDGFEFEVSLLDWRVINIKGIDKGASWDNVPKQIRNGFFEWLTRKSYKDGSQLTNKETLYDEWENGNETNSLSSWLDKQDGIDGDLEKFLNKQGVKLIELGKLVIDRLSQIYYYEQDKRQMIHDMTPQGIVDFLGLDKSLKDNNKALETIVRSENNVYLWSKP